MDVALELDCILIPDDRHNAARLHFHFERLSKLLTVFSDPAVERIGFKVEIEDFGARIVLKLNIEADRHHNAFRHATSVADLSEGWERLAEACLICGNAMTDLTTFAFKVPDWFGRPLYVVARYG